MSTPAPSLLVADDQPDVLEALCLVARTHGFVPTVARSPAEVLAAVRAQDFDVLLLDMNYARDTTSGQEGLALLDRLLALDPSLPIVLLTAWATVDGAVAALQRGARDYLAKPWDNDRLVTTLRTQAELRRTVRARQRLAEENARLRAPLEPAPIAQSAAMARVLAVVDRVAASSAQVLVTGEHGTGKEVIARLLHARSGRSGAFVAVNAGALSDGLFESELFGHTRGAFTDARADRMGSFELADGGTLFLDEIGNMPLAQQAKLLRVLQTGEVTRVGSSKVVRVDARVVSATNADLGKAVSEGRFREDLLYRLNTVELALPALRVRREDIEPLAHHFLARQALRYGRPVKGFSPQARTALLQHPWPGNVRELEHAIERAVLLATGDLLTVEDLSLRTAGERTALERMTLDEAERHLIARALERSGGNVSGAAAALGLSRSALYRRLERFGLSPGAEEP
jgi:DNA-binding NtrC family response regulator